MKRRDCIKLGIIALGGLIFGKAFNVSACPTHPYKTVKVKVRQHDNTEPYIAEIDECISPIVDALNKQGVNTITSCCGHGEKDGYIVLEDKLLIVAKESGKESYARYAREFKVMGEANQRKHRKNK